MSQPHVLTAFWRAVCIGLACTAGALATPVGTSFTYQGSLTQSGAPVNGAVPMEFRLFDASTDGNQVGPTLGGAIDVADGLFTASLDFGVGSYAVNQALWLEITVDGDLLGRQALEATPFALNTRGISVSQSGQVDIGPVNTFGGTRIDGVAPHSLALTSSGQPRFEIGIADDTGQYNVSAGQFDTVIRNLEIDSKMLFATGELTSPIMTLDGSTKRVGIGLNNPGRRLHVRGTDGVIRIDRSDFEPAIDFFDYDDSDDSFQNPPVANWYMGASETGFQIADRSDGNVNRFWIDRSSTGNVGIGTQSPSHKLDVRGSVRIGDGTTNEQDIDFFSQDGSWQVGTNSPAGGGGVDNNIFYIYDTSTQGYALTVTKGDNRVGIGTRAPNHTLDIVGNNSATLGLRSSGFGVPATIEFTGGPGAGQNTWEMGARGPDLLKDFHITSNVVGYAPFRINSDSGTVSIGNGQPILDDTLRVWGNVCANSYVCMSARALKEDITPLLGALDRIGRMEAVTYTWNERAGETLRGETDIGFIADDMLGVLPEVVSADADGNARGIDYAKLTPIAIQAIKELKAEHGDQLADLRADNDALRVRLERLELMLDTYARNAD